MAVSEAVSRGSTVATTSDNSYCNDSAAVAADAVLKRGRPTKAALEHELSA